MKKKIKMSTNSQPSTAQCKNIKVSKQPEQEQNYRYGDHLEGYQLGDGMGRVAEGVQRLRSIIYKYKIDRRMLRIV